MSEVINSKDINQAFGTAEDARAYQEALDTVAAHDAAQASYDQYLASQAGVESHIDRSDTDINYDNATSTEHIEDSRYSNQSLEQLGTTFEFLTQKANTLDKDDRQTIEHKPTTVRKDGKIIDVSESIDIKKLRAQMAHEIAPLKAAINRQLASKTTVETIRLQALADIEGQDIFASVITVSLNKKIEGIASGSNTPELTGQKLSERLQKVYDKELVKLKSAKENTANTPEATEPEPAAPKAEQDEPTPEPAKEPTPAATELADHANDTKNASEPEPQTEPDTTEPEPAADEPEDTPEPATKTTQADASEKDNIKELRKVKYDSIDGDFYQTAYTSNQRDAVLNFEENQFTKDAKDRKVILRTKDLGMIYIDGDIIYDLTDSRTGFKSYQIHDNDLPNAVNGQPWRLKDVDSTNVFELPTIASFTIACGEVDAESAKDAELAGSNPFEHAEHLAEIHRKGLMSDIDDQDTDDTSSDPTPDTDQQSHDTDSGVDSDKPEEDTDPTNAADTVNDDSDKKDKKSKRFGFGRIFTPFEIATDAVRKAHVKTITNSFQLKNSKIFTDPEHGSRNRKIVVGLGSTVLGVVGLSITWTAVKAGMAPTHHAKDFINTHGGSFATTHCSKAGNGNDLNIQVSRSTHIKPAGPKLPSYKLSDYKVSDKLADLNGAHKHAATAANHAATASAHAATQAQESFVLTPEHNSIWSNVQDGLKGMNIKPDNNHTSLVTDYIVKGAHLSPSQTEHLNVGAAFRMPSEHVIRQLIEEEEKKARA